MTDASWITCPHCGLKHRRRPDSQCPKCHQGVDAAPSAGAGAPAPRAGGKGGLTVCNMDHTRVVITDDAILQVSLKGGNPGAMAGGFAGGALGYLIGAALEHALEKGTPQTPASASSNPIVSLAAVDRVRVSTVADLPPEITGDPEFPRVAPDSKVTIFPRSAISAARLSIWDGLHLTTAEGPSKVGLAAWHMSKVRSHLERAGYRVTG